MIRHRAAGLALALLLVLVAACSGDDGGPGGQGSGSTTTATVPTEPTEGGGSGSTDQGDEGGTTTLPDETTTTAAPPVAGPADLQDRLVEVARFGEGFARDHTLGTGAFSGELCEDVTLEATWADQASQALTRGQGDDQQLVTQAVLAFADEGAAAAFVGTVVEGHETCLPGGERPEVTAGDEAVLVRVDSGATSTSLAVVRVGPRAAVFTALYPTAGGDPVTPDLLDAAAAALG